MSSPSTLLEKLYRLERKIFEEFALEDSKNIHVATVDLDNPLISVSRIILSDIIASQLHSKQPGLPIIITSKIFIEDISSKKYSYLELNQDGINCIKGLFKGLTRQIKDERIKEFRKSILTDKDDWCSKHLVNWSGKDESTNGREYKVRKEKLKKRFNIPFNNTKFQEVNEDEKFNYVIKIEHELYPDGKPLTKKNVENFLAKISVLALHTKKNKKNFSDIGRQATKSAISQVMARNMSHNIGSHVLSKFKDEKEIAHALGMFEDGKEEKKDSRRDSTDGQQYIANYELNEDLTGLKLIAYFNEYLKNRMDFLADIATTDPVMETSMYLVREVIKGFDRNRILLNRISGISPDIKFSIKIFRDDDEIDWIDHSRDPRMSIPNEILGTQAFYILLENFIRNIYKHGNPVGDFEIIIKVTDYNWNKSFYEVSLYDSLCKDKTGIESVVTDRIKALNDHILVGNSLRDNNLGTIEMDVCAAYLRCLPIISVDDTKRFQLEGDYESANPPKLIYPYAHRHNNENSSCYTLGYKFYIAKPKEVLVINDRGPFQISGKSHQDLADAGIEVIKSSEIGRRIFNHKLIYCTSDCATVKRIIEDHAGQLPRRIVYKNRNIKLNTIEGFIESVWEVYGTHQLRGSYCLVDGKVENKNNIRVDKNSIEVLTETAHCDNDSFTIFVDDHNEHWRNHNNYEYYDMACSHSKIQKFLPEITYKTDIRMIVEYLEVVRTKILLLDERIQDNIVIAKKPYKAHGSENKMLFADYFSYQKVFIPKKKEADFNAVSFGELGDKSNGVLRTNVSNEIWRYINSNIGDTTFCVIHLGILEKMLSKEKSKDAIEEVIGILFENKKNRRKLIVTSGRGKPNNLPPDIPFVPLALIQNAIETIFDKFVLTKILYNARKSI